MTDTLWGLIGGVILAVIVGTLIPFATTQFSLWSERRREAQRARREALTRYISAKHELQRSFHNETAAMKANLPRPSGDSGRSVRRDDLDNNDVNMAAELLHGHFTTSDDAVRAMFVRYAAGTHHADVELAILSTWAEGRDWRARRAARKLATDQPSTTA